MTTAAELDDIAANLAKTTAAIDRLIATEGKKIGDAYGKTYAKAAREQIEAKDAELRRANDLVAELRRQMQPLDRRSAQYFALEKSLKALIAEGRQRGQGVPADVLLDAIARAQRDGHTTKP